MTTVAVRPCDILPFSTNALNDRARRGGRSGFNFLQYALLPNMRNAFDVERVSAIASEIVGGNGRMVQRSLVYEITLSVQSLPPISRRQQCQARLIQEQRSVWYPAKSSQHFLQKCPINHVPLHHSDAGIEVSRQFQMIFLCHFRFTHGKRA